MRKNDIAKEIKVNEEKLLNNLKDYLNYLKGKNLMTSFRFNIIDLLENSISLIEKQQKEIEELLDNKKEINYIKPIDIPVHNYISKDKISEKIEELCKELLKYPFEDEWFLRDRIEEQIDLLKELLEENTNE